MNLLYDHKKAAECRHTFTINQGGDINLRVSNGSDRTVSIIFKDFKFHAVDWQVSGEWVNSRSAWWVRGAIADKIKELEDYYSALRRNALAGLCGSATGPTTRIATMQTDAQTASTRPGSLHPLVRHLIYGDIGEIPLNVLGDECPTQDDYENLDAEQDTRLQAAATVQAWIEGRLHRGGYLHDPTMHAETDRVPNDLALAQSGGEKTKPEE